MTAARFLNQPVSPTRSHATMTVPWFVSSSPGGVSRTLPQHAHCMGFHRTPPRKTRGRGTRNVPVLARVALGENDRIALVARIARDRPRVARMFRRLQRAGVERARSADT